MSQEATPFKIDRPTITEANITENRWYTVESSVYNILACVVENESSPLVAAQDLNSLFPSNRGWSSAETETLGSFLWEL